MNKNRGSQFRKWDMHLHSLNSHLNNNYNLTTETEEEKKEKLLKKIKDNGIEVVGLTNYFYFKEDDFRLKNFLEENGIATFLNLEVRLSNINKDDELFDYHIIFDKDLDQIIIENLQGELKANIGSDEKSFNLLTKQEIEQSAHVSLNKLHEALHNNSNLKDRYLTGFLSRGHGSATSDSDKKNMAVYEEICVKSDFIIHSSCNDPKNCKDKKCKHNNLTIDREYWLNQSKYTKPLLQSSDAHSLEQIGKKFSWIKADKTFEGFKQILFEPEDRICLEYERPVLEKDELVIDSIVYNDCEIYLSESLNSIIGGRSTGKSTFLNSIANRFGKNVEDHKFVFDETDIFKVFWRDHSENYDRQIEYIPQEFMFKLAEDENSLNELVNRIIKSKKLDEKIEDFKMSCNKLDNKISNLLNDYFASKEKLVNLQKPELEEESTIKRNKEYMEKRQEILGRNNFTEEEKLEFQKQTTDKESFETKISSAQDQIRALESLQYQEFRIQYDYDKKLLKPIEDDLNDFTEHLNKEVQDKYNAKVLGWTSLIDKKIIAWQKEIEGIQENMIYKKGMAISESNTELSLLDQRIRDGNEALGKITSYKEQKSNIKSEISSYKKQIIDNYSCYKDLRESLENDFEISEVDLEIKLEFKQIDLYNEFVFINGQGNTKTQFIENLQNDFDSEIDKIFDKKDLKYNNKKTEAELIQKFFGTHFYDYDFKIIYQVDEFKQMSPGKKAFVILKLILEFSDSKIPVLIDQPEDSLDNRAIYNELTKYIKETKRDRQIIIVTHNPNIVVGADCENIIVANQHSENSKNKNNVRFDYINGSLENSYVKKSPFVLERNGIREHIFEILEGGKEAFEKRKQKYNVEKM